MCSQRRNRDQHPRCWQVIFLHIIYSIVVFRSRKINAAQRPQPWLSQCPRTWVHQIPILQSHHRLQVRIHQLHQRPQILRLVVPTPNQQSSSHNQPLHPSQIPHNLSQSHPVDPKTRHLNIQTSHLLQHLRQSFLEPCHLKIQTRHFLQEQFDNVQTQILKH